MSIEALEQIIDIAEGSTTANSLQHIAKIARQAIADLEKQEPVAKGWCNGCNPDNCQGCGPAAKTNDEPIFWYRPVGEDGGYEGPIHNGAIEKVRKLSGIWKPLYTSPKVEQEPVAHWSDCAVHSEPAYPAGECDCGGYSVTKELFDSARSFYNATVADSEVRITSKNESKRDIASDAADRLRYALRSYQDTSPPQRQWVGLTPQERDEINEQVYGAVPHYVAFHHAIEAKLKQKNGYTEGQT
jgi:hypothetical protein